jgi:hypothetical protein
LSAIDSGSAGALGEAILEGDATNKGRLALALIGGQSVTPFFQACRDQPSRFSGCFAV